MQHLQTFFQTSENRIGEIWPNFYVVWTLSPGFWGQGVHFWVKKLDKKFPDEIVGGGRTWAHCQPMFQDLCSTGKRADSKHFYAESERRALHSVLASKSDKAKFAKQFSSGESFHRSIEVEKHIQPWWLGGKVVD